MKEIKRVEYDLKPHNVETIKRILEFYEQSNKCCAIQATGTGKTFLILRLLEIFNDDGKKAVVFAPNREIIRQTKRRMKKFGLDNAVFYTYQKLAKMTDDEVKSINADLIVCDELHRTGAKTWGAKFEVLAETHPQAKVFGVTATPLRCADGRDMAEEYFDNNKACDISLAEALVREIIPVMPLYVSGLFTFEEEYENMREKIKKSNNSNEEKAELQEVLLAAKQQMEKAKGVPQIIKKYITNYNGKYIVFCKDKTHLYAMKDVVVEWFREAGHTGKIFEYPYYSNSSEVKKNLDSFEANKEEGLKLLFVIDKLNEGLHLDEVHGCILLRTTTSNIIYYQQIGRAIDAGSNEQRVILDLVSNFNSLKSFNFKKELENKVKERREGRFAECSEEFEIDKFDVVDLVQECVDVFCEIDNKIIGLKDRWCDWEDEVVREFYNEKTELVFEKLSHRSRESVKMRASILGVAKRRDGKWTIEEIDIIKNHYPTIGIKVVDMLPHKTKDQIQHKAALLKVRAPIKEKKNASIKEKRRWTDNEIRILIERYDSNPKELCGCLNRGVREIQAKAARLGLSKRNIFTESEDLILKEFYPVEGERAFNKIDNHSKSSCRQRVFYLGLKVDRNQNYMAI